MAKFKRVSHDYFITGEGSKRASPGLKRGGTSAATKRKRAARKASRSTTLGRSTNATFSAPTITSSRMGGPFGAGAQQRGRQETHDRQKEKEFLDAKYGRTSQSANIPEATLGNYGYDDPMIQEAIRAVEEAKRKQEESKRSALGYYQPIQKALSEIQPELISSGQMAQMKTTRRAELGAYGQNLASMHTDPYSGVAGGQRRQIGMGIAGRQANLPIELGLEVGRANRQAQLGLYGAQAGVAGGMAGIQMAYQYDPGMEYLTQLGYGAGYEGRGSTYGPGAGVGALPGSPQLGPAPGGGMPGRGGMPGGQWKPGDPIPSLPGGGGQGRMPPWQPGQPIPAGYEIDKRIGGPTRLVRKREVYTDPEFRSRGAGESPWAYKKARGVVREKARSAWRERNKPYQPRRPPQRIGLDY